MSICKINMGPKCQINMGKICQIIMGYDVKLIWVQNAKSKWVQDVKLMWVKRDLFEDFCLFVNCEAYVVCGLKRDARVY